MEEKKKLQKNAKSNLRAGLLLLLLPQGKEGDTGDLDDLETDTGQISDGVAGTTETGNENLVVLIDKVQTTIVGDEGSDLLAVLDQLDTDTLANSRVGLLGLNTAIRLVEEWCKGDERVSYQGRWQLGVAEGGWAL